MLTNLITNAHLYTQPGSTIEVGARHDGNRVRLFVSDDGPGIAPEQQTRLFERFYRGAAGDRQAVGGTGLGLSIARSVVELHGGEITLDSEVGVGTTFHVDMPLAPPPGTRDAPTALILEADAVLGEILSTTERAIDRPSPVPPTA